MVVISYSIIRDFIIKHADAEDALNNWYRLVTQTQADWSSFHEIKQMFNSVDAIGNDRYVFNIRGNNYRLIALIFFNIRTVYIRFVGTHAEYDKLKNSNLI
ncbi:type II toxin-antitoxin system HigB family toxin [Pedobacter chinensis]|uniref:Type II toxin-antitoxin system HigB family toxin n=1 Tax=Pedobacter chinensis TaxID=2282421 RepID=A0A369PU68_9SPHI|nr:type II toxin-antitoxin system HigB family toxin [Pedobacter chinensis]RDC56123.1 type II toxin-antitoxin system HigB family toxin [Pedobacter chinensis]